MQRHGSIFLGTILIGIGGIYMLRAIDLWPDDVSTWPGVLIVLGVAILLDQILRDGSISWFMPIFLIGLGTFFLLRDSEVVNGDILLPAILICAGALVIAASFRQRPIESDFIDIPLEQARRARVRIDHGGGELRVGALAAGSQALITGKAVRVEQRVKRSGDRAEVSLRQTARSWTRTLRRDLSVQFSRAVEFELELNTGATDSRIDLSDLLVTSLHLKTGASSTKVWAPRRGNTAATVDAGAASVVFVIPDGVAARISLDTGLADVTVDTDRFPRQGGVYQSLDYDSVIDRLELRIKGGVASFRVA